MRPQSLLKDTGSPGASPLRADTEGDRKVLDVSVANVTAGPETDLTQEKAGAATEEPPAVSQRRSGLGMVKEKTEATIT